jgi:hypothetical protein
MIMVIITGYFHRSTATRGNPHRRTALRLGDDVRATVSGGGLSYPGLGERKHRPFMLWQPVAFRMKRAGGVIQPSPALTKEAPRAAEPGASFLFERRPGRKRLVAPVRFRSRDVGAPLSGPMVTMTMERRSVISIILVPITSRARRGRA